MSTFEKWLDIREEQYGFPGSNVPGVDKMQQDRGSDETPPTAPVDMGTPIDSDLLAEGLNSFNKVIINYNGHTKEGMQVAKWIIALSRDKRFKEVSQMLGQIQGLADNVPDKIREIYKRNLRR